MKKVRKGFTLVELLIVVAIIGIISAMMMISGSEASDAAKVLKIVEGFKNVSSAMQAYDANTPSASGDDADAILTGIKPYLRDQSSVVASDSDAEVGKYVIEVPDDGSWWIYYTLTTKDTSKLGSKLQEKKDAFGFYASSSATEGEYDYAGGTTIYVKVRS